MDQHQEGLKPCPFCGSEAALVLESKDPNCASTDCMAFCSSKDCGASLGIYEDETAAIRAWNRRTN